MLVVLSFGVGPCQPWGHLPDVPVSETATELLQRDQHQKKRSYVIAIVFDLFLMVAFYPSSDEEFICVFCFSAG